MTSDTDKAGGHHVKIRMLILPVVVAVALAGCTPEPDTSTSPHSSPDPSASQQSPSATPSTAPSDSPTATPVALPADCEALVPLGVVHREFSSHFAPVAYVAHPEDLIGQSFADRGGINCVWAIPNSEGFATVFVAERETASDAAQIANWRSAGYTESPGVLDACFSEEEETMVNTMQTIYALAGGFELRVRASAGSSGPLVALAIEAAANMGYN